MKKILALIIFMSCFFINSASADSIHYDGYDVIVDYSVPPGGKCISFIFNPRRSEGVGYPNGHEAPCINPVYRVSCGYLRTNSTDDYSLAGTRYLQRLIDGKWTTVNHQDSTNSSHMGWRGNITEEYEERPLLMDGKYRFVYENNTKYEQRVEFWFYYTEKSPIKGLVPIWKKSWEFTMPKVLGKGLYTDFRYKPSKKY